MTGILLFAQYTPNSTCKGCHPTIYKEFYNSAHRKSSIYEDEIHSAIWKLHPDKKKERYKCAKCHTPADLKLLDALDNNKTALPKDEDVQKKEAISCISCHSIKSIKEAKVHNINIMTKEPKMIYASDIKNRDKKIIFKEESSFFGLVKKTVGSPYHNIDYSNKNFYTGKMCMGCHSHLKNIENQDTCNVDMSGANNEKKNCITCHMPKVQGSATTIKITKKHTYHGFAGVRNKSNLLAQYIKLNLKKRKNGFDIEITNEATHNLLLHPTRLLVLNVKVLKESKLLPLKSVKFLRVLGKNNKPAMPWLGDSIFKDNMIKAGETRVIKYDTPLQNSDNVEVELGFYLVNPKILKKLSLENSKEATKYRVLKTKNFKIQ